MTTASELPDPVLLKARIRDPKALQLPGHDSRSGAVRKLERIPF